MQDTRLSYLLDQWLQGTLNEGELRELALKVRENEKNDLFEEHLVNLIKKEVPGSIRQDITERNRIVSTILNADKTIPLHRSDELNTPLPFNDIRTVSFLRKWRWAAAAILLVLGLGAYFRQASQKQLQPVVAAETATDITPGKNGAVLTLADGSQIVLDSLENGVVANQNGARVSLQNGGLIYDLAGPRTNEVAYNIMTTPKGRQFQIILPDGTRVWLNAASSIRYPTIFEGKERKVEINGEAFLEVAKNLKMPFRLIAGGQTEVKVLGTSFNVNAYSNEGTINTTLLDGAVAVSVVERTMHDTRDSGNKKGSTTDWKKPGNGVILKPGQQAMVHGSQQTGFEINLLEDVNLEKVIAWKNGVFNFNDIDFKAAMRQLERWYDIEVVYETIAPEGIELSGEITRDVTLNGLLKVLREIGVKCRLEGRKLWIES